MAKYDWNTFRSYVAFLASEMAPGTRCLHHDSELTSWYHDAFLPWDHYHNNIVLFYHDSPITRSHFMDPSDRAIKGFYCTCVPMPTSFQQSHLVGIHRLYQGLGTFMALHSDTEYAIYIHMVSLDLSWSQALRWCPTNEYTVTELAVQSQILRIGYTCNQSTSRVSEEKTIWI